MADNVTVLDSGGNSVTIASRDGSSVYFHRVDAEGYEAHDSPIAGYPVRVGARGVSTPYTAVADGDVADLVATLRGALVVRPYAIPEAAWSYAAASSGIGDGTAVTIKAAAAAGIKNYITSVQVGNSTLGAATEFAIRDGSGGTVLWRIRLETTALPPTTFVFADPLAGSAATLLEVICLTNPTSGGVFFNAQGHEAP